MTCVKSVAYQKSKIKQSYTRLIIALQYYTYLKSNNRALGALWCTYLCHFRENFLEGLIICMLSVDIHILSLTRRLLSP